MIVGNRKPIEEILGMVEGRQDVLIVGCGGCTSVCLAGGQREVGDLSTEIRRHYAEAGGEIAIREVTIERQCNESFFPVLNAMVATGPDALLSMACGAGVQLVAERYPKIPTYPALNTSFVGIDRDVGWYEESCRTCGDCVLADTGGVCPVARCAKSLFNGPCGGTGSEGTCEVDANVPCAWFEIHQRLKGQDRLHLLRKVRPPREWVNQKQRTVVQEAYRSRYARR